MREFSQCSVTVEPDGAEHLPACGLLVTVSVPDRVSTHANAGRLPGTGSGCRQSELSNRMESERPWEK